MPRSTLWPSSVADRADRSEGRSCGDPEVAAPVRLRETVPFAIRFDLRYRRSIPRFVTATAPNETLPIVVPATLSRRAPRIETVCLGLMSWSGSTCFEYLPRGRPSQRGGARVGPGANPEVRGRDARTGIAPDSENCPVSASAGRPRGPGLDLHQRVGGSEAVDDDHDAGAHSSPRTALRAARSTVRFRPDARWGRGSMFDNRTVHIPALHKCRDAPDNGLLAKQNGTL